VFEEDVDMELENERKSSLNAADQEAVAAIETSTSLAVETSTPTVNTPTLSTTAPKQHAVDKDSSRKETETTTEKTADTVEAPRTSDDVPVPSETAMEIATPTLKDTSNSTQNKEPEPEEPAKIESFAAAMSSGTPSDIGSRFYIKRRILVGNVSKFIAPGKKKKKKKKKKKRVFKKKKT